MNEYEKYLEERFRGEVFGEAVLGAMAEARRDPDEARKLRALAQLERETKELLRSAIEEGGGQAVVEGRRIEEGRALGAQMGQAPWLDLLGGMRPELVKFVEEFEEAETLALPGREALLRHVTAHERALLEFVDRELAGRPLDEALAPVLGLLREPPADLA